MLKTIPSNAFAGFANVKCAEIFCQSSNSFNIACTFCEMKSFNFNDFLLHFKNAHFENDLLKTDELTKLVTKCSENINNCATAAKATDGVIDHNSSIIHGNGYISTENEEEESDTDTSDVHGPKKDILDQKNDPVVMKSWQNETKFRNVKRGIGRSQQQSTDDDDLYECSIEADVDFEIDTDEEYKPPNLRKKQKHQSEKAQETSNTKSSSEFKCEHCAKCFCNKTMLIAHLKRMHDVCIENFNCNECVENFSKQRQLDSHIVTDHGGFPCTYEDCTSRFKNRYEVRRHEIKHSGIKSVFCDFAGCGKSFFTVRSRNSHRKIHSDVKDFVCDYCGYSCRSRETLRVHTRRHTGERPFSCDICTKSFKSHSGIREHMATHSKLRPHTCETCGATFGRQKALYHHKFLHADTKQFVCKICDTAYAQQAGLAGHMRRHRDGTL